MRFNIKIAGVWVTTVAASVGSFHTKKLKAEEFSSLSSPVKKSEEFANKSCIVVVASTSNFFFVKTNQIHFLYLLFYLGTGKSSTIAKYTKQNVAVSSGASSKTRYCQVFENMRVPSDPVW